PNTGGTPNTGGAAAGPVARWTFEEGSGLIAADGTGNGNTLTLACVAPCVDGVGANGYPGWETGHTGKGVSFYYYQIGRVAPSTSLASMAGAYTISAWVKRVLAHTAGDRSLWGRQATADGTEQLAAVTVNAGIIEAIGGSSRVADSANAPDANVWFHLTETWDGSTLRLYKDGSLVGSAAMTSTASANTLGGFVLGTRQQGTDLVGYADAVFDDVTLWSRALSTPEIAALTQ
ncbi:MAG: LamG domain-containing protein, partial [Deltaproteobacteria bacterium]|nr:LamG domain-containing protein [Deltaproteobacteria bacterium]